MTDKTILVVDDTEESRKLLALILKRLGYRIQEAFNGIACLTRIGVQLPDLVLLDVDMPDMSGTQVLQEIRKQHTALQLPVIMVTANDDQQSIVNALSLGANDYLVKPINPEITAERIRTQLSLARLSQLQDDVIHFASHDLKKPMLVMQDMLAAATELDLRSPDGQGEMHELLNLLQTTLQKMHGVVHGFLAKENDLTQGNDDTSLTHLGTLVQEICNTDQAYAHKKAIKLHTELAANLPGLNVPAFKLRQVLDNLIGNAIKYCPVSARVAIRGRIDNNQVLLEVSDNGPGLTPDDLQKLFRRNVTLSNKPTGGESSNGIGLPLCRELIESVGGRIGAYNNPDQGVTFWFRLPLPAST